MDIIITMAGLGSRFRKVGYNCPKYMIEGMPVTISIVDAKKVHVLGTPEELQVFLQEN